MDLNHDKQIQSLLCYRYTIGQTNASKVDGWPAESRLVKRFEAVKPLERLRLKTGHPRAPRPGALTS